MSGRITTLRFGDIPREKLLSGALVFARTVSATYGPCGSIVMMDRFAGILASKDGATVAREIDLSDPIENLGAKLLREACIRVGETVGDGTTSTAILASSMLEKAFQLISAGYDPSTLAREIRVASTQALSHLSNLAEPVENQEVLEQVALTSSNGDGEVAAALAEACMAVGKDGTISIEDGDSVRVELVFKDGMEINEGAHSGFLRESPERIIEGPLVAVFDSPLSSLSDIQHVLEESSQWPDHDLVVFAPSISGEALTTMLLNDSQDVIRSVAICSPGLGPVRQGYLTDLAALSGATLVDPVLGMDHTKGFNPDWFGSLRKAIVKSDSATLIAHEVNRDGIKNRINNLKLEMGRVVSDYDKDKLTERIAKLTGGLCVLKVGHFTEAALKERRARVEDALSAVKAALESGVVPGAGMAFLDSARSVDTSTEGGRLIAHCLRVPATVLIANSGENGKYLIHRICEEPYKGPWVGWDLLRKEYRDFRGWPFILDPVDVTLECVKASVSIVTTMLMVEACVLGA